MSEWYHVEVFKRTDGLWDWRVRAANGKVVATSGSRGYTERNDAREMAELLFPTLEVWHGEGE